MMKNLFQGLFDTSMTEVIAIGDFLLCHFHDSMNGFFILILLFRVGSSLNYILATHCNRYQH